MENILTINTIVISVSIIIGLSSILIIKKIFFKSQVKANIILELEKNGLIIENQELLFEKKAIQELRYVYFPVVPTRTPNLIHILFCFYLRKIVNSGLKVNLFVFDNYYTMLKCKSVDIAKSDVENFIYLMKNYSCNKNIKVIMQSDFIRLKSRSILKELFEISHSLTLGDINKIQKDKQYINDKVAFSRYMKPLSNMLYLKQTSKKYGFTLSGLDEKELWDLFEKTRDASKYKLCNLYIPKIEGLQSYSTSVLDTNYNISFGEKFDSVLQKTTEFFNRERNWSSDTCIVLFLKICIFQDKKEITYKLSDDNFISLTSWDALLEKFKMISTIEKENLLNSIATIIYQTINLKNV